MPRNVFLRLWLRTRERPRLALAGLVAAILVCLVGNATVFWLAERGAAGGPGFGDALWYSVISITTIGYGDYAATTVASRLATVVFIVICGLGTFSLAIGLVFDRVVAYFERGRKGMNPIVASDHVLIVNFPDKQKVRSLIHELQVDPVYKEKDLVVVTDQVEELPFSLPRVHFVQGSPLSRETLAQANVGKAAAALVLATGDPVSSDAVVAAQVLLIESLTDKSIYTVAECLDAEHRHLFAINRCDSIVSGTQVANNLLVQELQDNGIARTIEVITSNVEGDTLYSTKVADPAGARYAEMAKALLDRDANLLSVIRGAETFTTFRGREAAEGDTVIYLAQRRYGWAELLTMARREQPAAAAGNKEA